ncbi:MAG: hypothetical protein EPO08_08410 [Rhodospirillaceae bacterium]|nr:MAG: hypothetical protein EPO08_08410 [Rhodospirillaceae bacterium]
MSNLSITNLLSLLQNPALAQQQVADTATNGASTTDAAASTAAGQNLPSSAATAASGGPVNGAAAPVMSSDMTAVLLQMQQSQEMTDAQALLYGDTANSGSSLVDYLDGGSSNTTTDPTQTLLDQLTGASGQQSGSASLMSSNQSLLDYLNAIDTNTPATTDASGVALNSADSQTSATDAATLEALYSALGQTSPVAATATSVTADTGIPQAPPETSPTATG